MGARQLLQKLALMSGQDGRMSGNIRSNFPTQDSMSFANKQLSDSKAVSKPVQIKPVGISNAVPKMPSQSGSLPSITNPPNVGTVTKTGGADMGTIKNDPLVQYLKQKYAEAVADNESMMQTDCEIEPEADSRPEPHAFTQGVVDTQDALKGLFAHKASFRKKFKSKDR